MRHNIAHPRTATTAEITAAGVSELIEDYMDFAECQIQQRGFCDPIALFRVEDGTLALTPNPWCQCGMQKTLATARDFTTAVHPYCAAWLCESWLTFTTVGHDSGVQRHTKEIISLRLETPTSKHWAYRAILRDSAGNFTGLGKLVAPSVLPSDDMAGFYPDHEPTPDEQAAAFERLKPAFGRADLERLAGMGPARAA